MTAIRFGKIYELGPKSIAEFKRRCEANGNMSFGIQYVQELTGDDALGGPLVSGEGTNIRINYALDLPGLLGGEAFRVYTNTDTPDADEFQRVEAVRSEGLTDKITRDCPELAGKTLGDVCDNPPNDLDEVGAIAGVHVMKTLRDTGEAATMNTDWASETPVHRFD